MKNVSKTLKCLLCVILVLSILVSATITISAQNSSTASELADIQAMRNEYLNPSDEIRKLYPSGIMMLPVNTGDLEMESFYAFHIFRQGGTEGEAKIKLKTIDLNAEYGIDYQIYENENLLSSPMEGKANPYYAVQDQSYIAYQSENSTSYVTPGDDGENNSLISVEDDISDANDTINEIMPVSGTMDIVFSEGEDDKTIYIRTLKSDQVSDDKQFMITISEPENCKVGSDVSSMFTIKERREKPETYIRIGDLNLSPDSEVAYVKIQRQGNLGGRQNLRFNTIGGSAQAETDYEPVCMNLSFVPGMTEIKVPVTLIDPKLNTQFEAQITDVTNAQVTKDRAEIRFIYTGEKQKIAETGKEIELSSSGADVLTRSSKTRGVIYINTNTFNKSCNIGDDYSVSLDGSSIVLHYENGMSTHDHAVSAVSPSTIDFTGVKQVHVAFDNKTGSCEWDDSAVVISDSDPLKDGDGSMKWKDNLSGKGTTWNMTEVAKDNITKTFDVSESYWGSHNFYLALHKGGFWGSCGVRFHNSGDNDQSSSNYLILQDYNISIIDPEPVQLYVDGKLEKVAVAKNAEMIDPGSSSSSTQTRVKSCTIYRDETAAIVTAIDENYQQMLTFKGIYFCKPGDNDDHSELVSLGSSSFTLTSELISKYKGYFDGNNIAIRPVYEMADSEITVENSSNETTGIKVNADNSQKSADVYKDDTLIAKITWTKSERDDQSYKTGDELKFEYQPVESEGNLYQITYDTRSASTKDLLPQATIVTYNNGENTIDLKSTDQYFSVTPNLIKLNTDPKLIVKNPSSGDYAGKNSIFETVDAQSGEAVVTGFIADDGSEISFKNYDISSMMSLFAVPSDGYAAKWTYTDSVSRETREYYGQNFYFAVQNPYMADDNTITLEFVPLSDDLKSREITLSGRTLQVRGTILNPPVKDSEILDICPNTLINFENNTTMSDGQGNFIFSNDDGSAVTFNIIPGKSYRAQGFANNQYYIVDIVLPDEDTVNTDITLPYKTYGVTPVSITAIDEDGGTYNDTITLVKTKAISFDLRISREGEDKDKPVNLVRWSIENNSGADGMRYDIDLDPKDCISHFSSVISEIAHQGDRLTVELMNVSYDKDSNPVYKYYGKFDTGYNFIATSIEETITYMPDLGVYSTASTDFVAPTGSDDDVETMAEPIPCVGPISPMVSLFGFTPVFSISSTGQKDDAGHDLYSVTIGLSFGRFNNLADKDSSWANKTISEKAQKIEKVLNDLDSIEKSGGGFKAFGGGSALNLKTAVSLSFSVTFCFQANYYTDQDTGEWRFTSSIIIIGVGGSIRVSVPFVLLYIPCFAFIEFTGDFAAYVGIFPKESPEGQSVYLTLKELNDRQKSQIQGVYEIKVSLSFGLGVGYDGLLSASGHLDNSFDIQLNDVGKGVGTYALGGGIKLQLLFLSASWDGDLFDVEFFNTLDPADVATTAMNRFDAMNTVSIGDMVIQDCVTTDDFITSIKNADTVNEKAMFRSGSIDTPSMIPLDQDRFFIAACMKEDDDIIPTLHYFIYDSKTETCTDPTEVLKTAGNQSDHAAHRISDDDLSKITEYVHTGASLTDLGDDILIAWNACTNNSESNTEKLKGVSVATIMYNKQSGQMHDLYILEKDESEKNRVSLNPTVIYDDQSRQVSLFYQSIDFTDVDDSMTLDDVNSLPVDIYMAHMSEEDIPHWGSPDVILSNEKRVTYYDAISRGGEIYLTYVGTERSGFTLEDMGNVSYDPAYVDPDQFKTVNSMYLRKISFAGNDALVSDPIQLTDEKYVVANPNLVRIESGDADNLLLFYKSNGKYAYQNIDTLLNLGTYQSGTGETKITDDMMEPVFISDEPDHTVNDDLKVISDGSGTIYCVWTVTEGKQQQLWANHFFVDSVDSVTQVTMLDENGEVIKDSQGNPQMKDLDEPVSVINGYWGGKQYLTTGGVNGSETHGCFKEGFDAYILNDHEIAAVFNAYDFEKVDGVHQNTNNRFVIGEYDTRAKFELGESKNQMSFSSDYPTQGEVVKILMKAKNTGVQPGKDVKFNLFINGELYSTQTVERFYADTWETAQAEYTVPADTDPSDITMYYTVTQNGEQMAKSENYSFSHDSRIRINKAHITPLNYYENENDKVIYDLSVEIWNTGNSNYPGGDILKFVDSDLYAQTAALDDDIECDDPIYTQYGSIRLPKINTGEKITLRFLSDGIPKSVFEKSAGGDSANLEFLITPATDNRKKLYAEDRFTILDSFNFGQTQTPRPLKTRMISADDMSLTAGAKSLISPKIFPLRNSAYADITYYSSDSRIASVDKNGLVTGIRPGEAKITLKSGDIEEVINVSVDYALGDVDRDGQITIIDVTMTQQYLAKLIELDKQQLILADVDKDGTLSIVDTTMIQQSLAKLRTLPLK